MSVDPQSAGGRGRDGENRRTARGAGAGDAKFHPVPTPRRIGNSGEAKEAAVFLVSDIDRVRSELVLGVIRSHSKQARVYRSFACVRHFHAYRFEPARPDIERLAEDRFTLNGLDEERSAAPRQLRHRPGQDGHARDLRGDKERAERQRDPVHRYTGSMTSGASTSCAARHTGTAIHRV